MYLSRTKRFSHLALPTIHPQPFHLHSLMFCQRRVSQSVVIREYHTTMTIQLTFSNESQLSRPPFYPHRPPISLMENYARRCSDIIWCMLSPSPLGVKCPRCATVSNNNQ